eukprot:932041-Prorocentrum_minimum.AAC.1
MRVAALEQLADEAAERAAGGEGGVKGGVKVQTAARLRRAAAAIRVAAQLLFQGYHVVRSGTHASPLPST